MTYYYYLDPIAKNQYFVNVDSMKNISEAKIKNAISKEAVKTFIERLGIVNVNDEDKKNLIKRIKTSIYYTCTLLENYNNVEISGDFQKTVAILENIEIIDNQGSLKTIEAEKLNSKVLENVYIIKDGNFYNVYYKKVFLLCCKYKSDIEKKLNENIDKIEDHVDNVLVKFRYIAPTTDAQLTTYKDELIRDIEFIEDRIERMTKRDTEEYMIDIQRNELNALKDELILVENMLNGETVNAPEVAETIKEVEKIVNDFTLDCMEIIESIVNKDSSGAEEVIKEIYNNYSKENMIQTIKYINKEFSRLELNSDADYIKAYSRLKEILKNIETLKDAYSFNNNEVVNNSVLTILNKYHYNKKYYTFNHSDNKIHLTIHNISDGGTLRLEQSYKDVWNSKECDLLYTKDIHNNIYCFKFVNNRYELVDAYTINKVGLSKGIDYNSIYGLIKVS